MVLQSIIYTLMNIHWKPWIYSTHRLSEIDTALTNNLDVTAIVVMNCLCEMLNHQKAVLTNPDDSMVEALSLDKCSHRSLH